MLEFFERLRLKKFSQFSLVDPLSRLKPQGSSCIVTFQMELEATEQFLDGAISHFSVMFSSELTIVFELKPERGWKFCAISSTFAPKIACAMWGQTGKLCYEL